MLVQLSVTVVDCRTEVTEEEVSELNEDEVEICEIVGEVEGVEAVDALRNGFEGI